MDWDKEMGLLRLLRPAADAHIVVMEYQRRPRVE